MPAGGEFHRTLTVLERNALVHYVSLALLVAGPLLLATLAAGFPPGVFGLHLAGLGAALQVGVIFQNYRAKRRKADVRATSEGVFVRGKLVVPREAIADGFYQPRVAVQPRGFWSVDHESSVRFVDKRRRVLFEAETDEAEALEMLRVLGLDPASKRAEFRGSSPVFSTLLRQLAFTFGLVAVIWICGLVEHSLGAQGFVPILTMLGVPAAFLAGMYPSRIVVGVDGIHLGWFWSKELIPMAEIQHASPLGDGAIGLQLASGEERILYTSMRHRSPSAYARQHRDAVLARIAEALAAFRRRGPSADVAALVARGTRTRHQWLGALRALGRDAGGYRDAAVRDDDLWRVVEDPAAPEDARAGAAVLLRRSLDDEGKARVRVAAEATASPKLRVALEAAAAESETEAECEAALAELAPDEA